MSDVPEVASGAKTVLSVDLVDELLFKLPPTSLLLLVVVVAVFGKLDELFDDADPTEAVALYWTEDPILVEPPSPELNELVGAEELV